MDKLKSIEKLKQTLNEASDNLKEQANQLSAAVKEQANLLGDSVKEKAYSMIEDWLAIFPKLESYGLNITSFGLKMGLNPTLEVELQGNSKGFTPEKVTLMLQENKGNNALTMVFKAIKTAYDWHAKTGSHCHFKSIFLKVSVCITPEVMVYLGEPKLM
ncbi:MAG: hypothetical protein ACK4GN_00560 [Runella sp.]